MSCTNPICFRLAELNPGSFSIGSSIRSPPCGVFSLFFLAGLMNVKSVPFWEMKWISWLQSATSWSALIGNFEWRFWHRVRNFCMALFISLFSSEMRGSYCTSGSQLFDVDIRQANVVFMVSLSFLFINLMCMKTSGPDWGKCIQWHWSRELDQQVFWVPTVLLTIMLLQFL